MPPLTPEAQTTTKILFFNLIVHAADAGTTKNHENAVFQSTAHAAGLHLAGQTEMKLSFFNLIIHAAGLHLAGQTEMKLSFFNLIFPADLFCAIGFIICVGKNVCQ